MKVTKKDVIRLLREEYEARIKSALNEVDMFDSTGQLIITTDLKVKHKPSGYVYTVADVQGKGDDAKVILRKPEEPRLNPPADEKARFPSPDERALAFEKDDDDEDDKETEDMKDMGRKAHPKVKPPPDKLKKDRVFIVDRSDFERNYEEA
jgi:hypothetical protein